MQINLNIMLAEGETLPMSAEDMATQVLDVLGGDTSKDYCSVSVSTAPTTIMVGVIPPPLDASAPPPG